MLQFERASTPMCSHGYTLFSHSRQEASCLKKTRGRFSLAGSTRGRKSVDSQANLAWYPGRFVELSSPPQPALTEPAGARNPQGVDEPNPILGVCPLSHPGWLILVRI
jgi:hypothetical protein